MMDVDDFFLQPINELQVSDEFKKTAALLNFQTLHDLMEMQGADLLRMPGVTYHLMQEFIQLLEEKGHAHLLKE